MNDRSNSPSIELQHFGGRATPNGNAALGSAANGDHTDLLEVLYEQWRNFPESVEESWRHFFEGFELGCTQPPPDRTGGTNGSQSSNGNAGGGNGAVIVSAPGESLAPSAEALSQRAKQAHLYNLLFAYRTSGHYIARIDPLGFNTKSIPYLDLQNFKLSKEDFETTFDSGTLAGGGDRKLKDILSIVQETYCDTVGVEFMHMHDFTMRRWLRDRMEKCRNHPNFSTAKKKRILNHVLEGELFERFLHTRYVGQKRFSLEGGETLIPMLDAVVEKCPELGVSQIVMGMAHRGRLNVLANILGKNYKFIFNEFAENYSPQAVQGDGDVKYHMGFEATQLTADGSRVGISLAPNPSHLEAVGPVVQGKARAWQRLLNDTKERGKVLPILIHGDAAFAGQGVVMETLNMSQLEGYQTGGTVHIIINNQIGFTTLPQDGRSTDYCTAVAKMLGAPIFHVNGDDPQAAVYVMELAFEFRQRFKREVVVDLVCYRRLGHNEGEEPDFTQPVMYSAIDDHDLVSELYLKELLASGEISESEASAYHAKFEQKLNDALAESKAMVQGMAPSIRKPLSTPQIMEPFESAALPEVVQKVATALSNLPPVGFHANPKLLKWLERRREMSTGKLPVDWSMGEALAFGTLLYEGVPVRLSGQDSRRGTFTQRHSVLYDTRTRERYVALKNISEDQASFCCYNSPLSEYAVLGFDFGYSLDYPNMLCLWEAQFGDFGNGAQVVIDQYITSSESKWGISTGIVLLLPHGYEGQGPEHSSARLERYLQACAEDNIQVANCTTPASFFHLLRRQGLRKIRKPLVVMSPKRLLRDKHCVSDISEFSKGCFEEILPDARNTQNARKLILCSGKVYYDLDDYRVAKNVEDTAIVRFEQLYPFHEAKLKGIVAGQKFEKIVWCQEESQNMGAWSYIEPYLRKSFGTEITYAGRDASASPATGSLGIHKLEQADVIEQAFRA
ncbi:MAG: 2-oxoglutarate dehydrogenase E1 component [Candidatus Methylacidiphilales bacterium]|nr:2-oxoglutarate dehydrogenase E1 component [Candidatus Methylacidiphilales bacterium]